MSKVWAFETPYSVAKSAVLTFLREHVCSEVNEGDIITPVRRADLASPVFIRYGFRTNVGEIDKELRMNMPNFVGIKCIEGDKYPCNIKMFRSVHAENGYVNFLVDDEFMLYFADHIVEMLPMGKLANDIIVPSGAEYVHARLLNYARVNEQYIPSEKKRRALWLSFALLEEQSELKQKRTLSAVIRAVQDALPSDKEGGVFGGSAAGAIAALVNCFGCCYLPK